jgi:hypothetical protein
MSLIDTQEELSEDTVAHSESDSAKLVPVAESIRYRKRAQSAEKQVQTLTEELAEAKSQATQLSEQLKTVQVEQELVQKLAAAGAVDLESAILIAKARIDDADNADLDSVIEQLKRQKQYLFGSSKEKVASKKTASAKDRLASGQTVLEKAANKAATTGNRRDLQEYLKLRRNVL